MVHGTGVVNVVVTVRVAGEVHVGLLRDWLVLDRVRRTNAVWIFQDSGRQVFHRLNLLVGARLVRVVSTVA